LDLAVLHSYHSILNARMRDLSVPQVRPIANLRFKGLVFDIFFVGFLMFFLMVPSLVLNILLWESPLFGCFPKIE
jgi:hypothetical protein